MAIGGYRFRRSFGNVSSQFRGARPDTYPLTDPDVIEFAEESGATDLSGLDALVKYVKSQGLYDNFVIYPMKSAQNAGSGATVYSLGGLTANNVTLSNSPSWGPSGITFNSADSQCGSVPDFLGGSERYYFAKISPASSSPNGVQGIIGQGNIISPSDGTLSSYIQIRESQSGSLNQNSYEVYQSSNGTTDSPDSVIYGTAVDTIEANSDTIVARSIPDSTLIQVSRNESLVATSKGFGSNQSSIFNSSADIKLFCREQNGSDANFFDGIGIAMAIYAGSLTTEQRDTITGYINNLENNVESESEWLVHMPTPSDQIPTTLPDRFAARLTFNSGRWTQDSTDRHLPKDIMSMSSIWYPTGDNRAFMFQFYTDGDIRLLYSLDGTSGTSTNSQLGLNGLCRTFDYDLFVYCDGTETTFGTRYFNKTFSANINPSAVGDFEIGDFDNGSSGSNSNYEDLATISDFAFDRVGFWDLTGSSITASDFISYIQSEQWNGRYEGGTSSKIACVGDSITWGVNNSGQSWVDDLRIARPEDGIRKMGSSAGRQEQLDTMWYDDLDRHSQDVVCILFGVNEIHEGNSAATVWANYEAVLNDIISSGRKVVISTILPFKNASVWDPADQIELDAINVSIENWANSNQNAAFVDGYVQMEDGTNADELNAAYDSGDGIHPNATGQSVLSGLFDSALSTII